MRLFLLLRFVSVVDFLFFSFLTSMNHHFPDSGLLLLHNGLTCVSMSVVCLSVYEWVLCFETGLVDNK